MIAPHNDGLTTESPRRWRSRGQLVDPADRHRHGGRRSPIRLDAAAPGHTSSSRCSRICSSDIKGPLEIEGGIGGAVHPLVKAVVLPGEANPPVFAIAPQPPEGESIDILNVFDDSSQEDKMGTLSGTQLTGFDLAAALHFDQTAFGESNDFAAGITYGKNGHDIEHRGVQPADGFGQRLAHHHEHAAHQRAAWRTDDRPRRRQRERAGAGARRPTPATIDGDRITVTGGGGPTSPLVIYGDTSQDASWYAGRPYDADMQRHARARARTRSRRTRSTACPRANPFDRRATT